MRRGDIITVAVSGDYGKPRRALVIQSDNLPETDSVLVCLLTTMLRDAPLYRLPLSASPQCLFGNWIGSAWRVFSAQ